MATLQDKSVDDELASLKIYFEEEEWKEMSDSVKERYASLKKDYEFVVGIGIEASMPTFMQKKMEEVGIGDTTDAQKSQVKRCNHNMCSAPTSSIGKCAYSQTLNGTTKGIVSNQSLINSTYAPNKLSNSEECKLSQNLDNRNTNNLKISSGIYINDESAVEEKSDDHLLGKENVHVTDGSKRINRADSKQLFRKQLKCPQCEYSTGKISDLRRHINGVHKKIKPYKCQQCDYRSSKASSLQRHVDAVHEGKKPYKCEKCEYRSSRVDTLRMHVMRVHEGNRPYKCQKCEYRSSEAGTLRKHVDAVHEGKKPYKCERCEFRSSRVDGLRTHVDNVHEGKKPYKCEMCEYRSSRVDALRRHVDGVHEDKKTYKCPKCEYTSSYPSDLRRHIKRVHGGKSDDNVSKG